MAEEFVDRIIEGFQTLRTRPHLDVLADQFEAGEIAFLVDHRGIRVLSGEDADALEAPPSLD